MATTNQRNDLVVDNLGVTGDLAVDGDLTADNLVTGDITADDIAAAVVTGTSFNGVLAGVTAPVELTATGVDAAALWTALESLGLIVEPA